MIHLEPVVILGVGGHENCSGSGQLVEARRGNYEHTVVTGDDNFGTEEFRVRCPECGSMVEVPSWQRKRVIRW